MKSVIKAYLLKFTRIVSWIFVEKKEWIGFVCSAANIIILILVAWKQANDQNTSKSVKSESVTVYDAIKNI